MVIEKTTTLKNHDTTRSKIKTKEKKHPLNHETELPCRTTACCNLLLFLHYLKWYKCLTLTLKVTNNTLKLAACSPNPRSTVPNPRGTFPNPRSTFRGALFIIQGATFPNRNALLRDLFLILQLCFLMFIQQLTGYAP